VKRFVFLLWAFSLAVWAAPELPDSKLMEMINVGREEGHLLTSDKVRVVHPADFPEVTVVGFLSGPNECLVGKALLDNKLVSPAEACGLVLRAHGWEGADGPARVALALQWLEQAQLGFGESILRSRPLHFGDKWTPYTPLDTLANLSGSVRVVCWVEKPPNGEPRRRFHKNLYWFGKDGRMLRAKVLDTFELDS